MEISNLITDDAVLTEIGKRIARYRIDQQVTQADLAEQAGVSKRTVERLEAGASVQFSTIIRIMRALNLSRGLDQMIPAPSPRPMALLKQKGKVRQRASSRSRSDTVPETWSWGEDS
ncbi:MAG: transcriptional regulator [Deltaproteobacteria bacterium]|nr:MAG: transcriptional regulator [Deltaproteobacteria bacterium]